MKLIAEYKDKWNGKWYVLYKNKNDFYVDYSFADHVTSKNYDDAQTWRRLEQVKAFLKEYKDELKGFKIAQVTSTQTEHFKIKGIL